MFERDRLDRLASSTPRSPGTTAPRCRSCGRPRCAGDTSPDIEWVRAHAAAAAGAAGRRVRLLQHPAADQPVPAAETIRAPGRVSPARRRRLAARGREVHAASRARCGSCAAAACCRCCRSVPPEQPWHSTPVSGAAARSTCRTRAWRSPGRASSRAAAPSPATMIVPFLTEGYEGFDINAPRDWVLAEQLLRRRAAPEVAAADRRAARWRADWRSSMTGRSAYIPPAEFAACAATATRRRSGWRCSPTCAALNTLS